MGIDVDRSKLTLVVPGVWKKNDKTYYIECSVNGTLHYCIKDRLDKLVTKQGSMEAVGSSYISRDAQRVLKPVTTTASAINKRNAMLDRIKLDPAPKFTHHGAGDHRVGSYLSDSWTKCLRPLLFQDNGNYCNGCRWHDICKVPSRGWKNFQDEGVRQVQAQFADYEVYTEKESIENMAK